MGTTSPALSPPPHGERITGAIGVPLIGAADAAGRAGHRRHRAGARTPGGSPSWATGRRTRTGRHRSVLQAHAVFDAPDGILGDDQIVAMTPASRGQRRRSVMQRIGGRPDPGHARRRAGRAPARRRARRVPRLTRRRSRCRTPRRCCRAPRRSPADPVPLPRATSDTEYSRSTASRPACSSPGRDLRLQPGLPAGDERGRDERRGAAGRAAPRRRAGPAPLLRGRRPVAGVAVAARGRRRPRAARGVRAGAARIAAHRGIPRRAATRRRRGRRGLAEALVRFTGLVDPPPALFGAPGDRRTGDQLTGRRRWTAPKVDAGLGGVLVDLGQLRRRSNVFRSAARLASSWATLLAPITDEVIRGSRNAQASAI